ncbi:hypothetical protein [Aquimarina aquimarini]|uniref:hypothetical protein n=1 Tax=Aquimarina aquimarini TaxID=1191734 RepID=UPI00131F3342|nr:hypothetical protein [Aquimarina aquimarini]
MNKIIIIQLVMFFSFSSFFAIHAQEVKEEGQLLTTNQDKFIAISQVNDVLSQVSDRNASSVTMRDNAIFIQQIGANNRVFSSVVAESSNINIIQKGDHNKIDINESARSIEKVISQTGTNNSVIDFSFNPSIATKLELLQEGNDLIFERFGSNELSKNLKFKMSGDARTIIVRSF